VAPPIAITPEQRKHGIARQGRVKGGDGHGLIHYSLKTITFWICKRVFYLNFLYFSKIILLQFRRIFYYLIDQNEIEWNCPISGHG
jgi:hypothetical protein